MANKPAYIEFLLDWLRPLGRIDRKRMFSGDALYVDGRVFALVGRDTLYLKADDVNRPKFEALGIQPFRPWPDKPAALPYYPPPAEFFEDPDVMLEWGRSAVQASIRAAAAKSPRKNTKKNATKRNKRA